MGEERPGDPTSSSTVFRRLRRAIDDLADTSGEPRWSPAIEGLIFSQLFLGIALWASGWSVWVSAHSTMIHALAWILIAAELVIAVWQAVLLRSYRLTFRHRVRQSGILQKLALGLDALPDIHSCTPFPVNRLLGPRPVTIEQSLKFISNHITWFAESQPATYWGGIRSAWLVENVLLFGGLLLLVTTGTLKYIEFGSILLVAMSVFAQQFFFLHGKNAYGRAAFNQELREMENL